MITEQELKDRCTPEFIKWMCEYAEGFRLLNDYTLFAFESFDCRINGVHESLCLLPLLIHRAAEGWNKLKRDEIFKEIVIYKDKVCLDNYKLETKQGYEDYYKYTLIDKNFSNYQPQLLTQCELALLHCLLDIY